MKSEPVLDLQNIKDLQIHSNVMGGAPPFQNVDDAVLSLIFYDREKLEHGYVGKIRMSKPQFEEIVRQGMDIFGIHVGHIEKEADPK